jgi:serine/threonine protein kinase
VLVSSSGAGVALGAAVGDPVRVLSVGDLVDDRYEVVEVLSRGAAAVVYRVQHRVLRRNFALKTLRIERRGDAEWAERLLREARALGALEHPNIVSVVDLGWLVSGEPYFVMEYAEGVGLDRWLVEQGPLDPELVAEVATAICDALEAAHGVGIVHRDLKPDNVWVLRRAGNCRVKVLDFGLARTEGQGRLTRPSTTHGTPEYMSPEQATGQELDARTDVYSLGVTLYELLCGRRPFEADSYVALAHQHVYAPPPPFTRWLPADSEARRLEPIVLRCLAKDRERRFASAADVACALSSFGTPGKTLFVPRLPAPPPAPAVPAAGSPSRHSFLRGLRYATLFAWTVVGCCLGVLWLCLVH